ncbi:SAM-dependent methyltransferase [Oceanospirillum linum]|uniref:SAM-dependent methyltransferase n=1 Tax=Oceanospirillum linum TaxID=966 RepID=UPI00089EE2DD|nr:SAM-dependent methyltransferase [Oceanospirillum linum]SEG42156.1 Putative methyltransferase [Oleiphilus messinensis]SMP33285.1 Putative methyltransferase [Oceanospirillum linum]
MKHRPHGNKSFGNSREIHTTQDGPHDELVDRVFKHCREPFKKPYQQHNLDAFNKASNWLRGQKKPLILDSCCGVGESTRQLAQMFPDHAVIGVDQSEDRLSRKLGELPDNALLVRANLLDFWRSAVDAGWKPVRHYLLYPNPYPKKSQFKLRWQGGPMLPYIAELGGASSVAVTGRSMCRRWLRPLVCYVYLPVKHWMKIWAVLKPQCWIPQLLRLWLLSLIRY